MTKPKPQIDRNAEIAQTADVAMPASENDSPSMFRPAAGIGTVDVFEITLMYLLELSQSSAHFPPGTLRNLALSAVRTGELSESARRFMVEVQQSAQVPAQPAPPAEPTGPVQ